MTASNPPIAGKNVFGSSVFALASCQYPPDLLHERLAYKSAWDMHDVFSSRFASHLKYLLFAGDSIYADATAGLFDPEDPREKFDLAYKRQIGSRAWQALNRTLQHSCYAIDDHEIIDNWEPGPGYKKDPDGYWYSKEYRDAAIKRFRFYRGLDSVAADDTLWYDTILNGIPVFVMDSRTEREAREAGNVSSKRLFGKQQRDALFKWLANQARLESSNKAAQRPKIILSGSMLFPRKLETAQAGSLGAAAIRSDAWDGYPLSMHEVLMYIAEHSISNVMFLSGDEHLHCLARATLELPGRKPVAVTSIHSSPLYGPFPFANNRVENFALTEHYTKDAIEQQLGKLKVAVETPYIRTGDGYALLEIVRNGHGFSQDIHFFGETENSFSL